MAQLNNLKKTQRRNRQGVYAYILKNKSKQYNVLNRYNLCNNNSKTFFHDTETRLHFFQFVLVFTFWTSAPKQVAKNENKKMKYQC